MNRTQLEHIIRAAGAIANDVEVVIIGSQSILGQFPDAPSELLVSVEADVYPKNFPERADLIDGSIGEASVFESSFGYYAHGVSPETATLPEGWMDRLIVIANENTQGIKGLCLEAHDLAISKYIAGREKDLNFTKLLAKYFLVDRQTLLERLRLTKLSENVRTIVKQRIDFDFTSGSH